ncbi:MAG: YqeG family HAD IIIA-type phosphatase [Planctomycetia bacterium]|nr:YqeG family HAD IIIA-type phosphatase [Planctomycetia bacterium]
MKIKYPFLSRLFFGVFLPNYRVSVVNELTPKILTEMGVESVLLDVDCTLKRYDCDILEPWVEAWLDTLKDANIQVCLLSNGKGKRIGRFAERYGLPYMAMAVKPLPFGCLRAIRRQGFQRRSTAMIGDQIFADILAGNLAGLKTVLVTPIHPEMEPLFTRVKRPFEKFIIKLIPSHARKPTVQ